MALLALSNVLRQSFPVDFVHFLCSALWSYDQSRICCINNLKENRRKGIHDIWGRYLNESTSEFLWFKAACSREFAKPQHKLERQRNYSLFSCEIVPLVKKLWSRSFQFYDSEIQLLSFCTVDQEIVAVKLTHYIFAVRKASVSPAFN